MGEKQLRGRDSKFFFKKKNYIIICIIKIMYLNKYENNE